MFSLGFNSSIYGPGVMNDTIVPGYPITKFPLNFTTWRALGNRGTTRNFGESTQYELFPAGHSQLEYALAQNYTDPNHIRQWDPMLLTMGGMPIQGTTNPYLSQAGLVSAYNYGAGLRQSMDMQSSIQQLAQTLSSIETGLTKLLNSENITDAHKAKIKTALEKVEACKKEIEEILKNNPDQQKIADCQKKVLNLQQEISKIAEEISKDLQKKSGNSEGASNGNGSSNGSGNSDGSNGVEIGGKTIDPKTGKPTSLTTPSNADLEAITSQIFTAIDGPGTDNDALADAIGKIDKNNVIEVVDHWTKTRSGNIFDEIFDDINDSDEKKYVPVIVKALTERAEELGIYDKIQDDIQKVNQDLARTKVWGMKSWIDDDQLKTDLMAIVDKIKKVESSNKSQAQKIQKDQKVKDAQKSKEAKENTKKEKQAEFARDMKKALKLEETPELATDLQVVIDDEGNFTGYKIEVEGCTYEGATYSELAKKLKEQDLDPKECLVKKKLDQAA